MAGDWIKMRVSLKKDPCVISMADFLAHQRVFMNYITDPVRQSCKESVYEHITSDVTRDITVSSLLDVWGVARDRGDRDGDDLLLKHCTVASLDDMCGVPCFGEAMEYVEWVIEETTTDAKGREIHWIRFPKFFKEHEAPEEKYKKQHAEAQAKYRAKKQLEKAAEMPEESDVTSDVTVTHREEKRREDISTSSLRSDVARKPRATKRCPADFVVTDEMAEAARAECPGLDLNRETTKFRDHEFKQAHSDWAATWRNWMRNAFERMPNVRGSPPSETAYQRSMRERVAQAAGSMAHIVAAKPPGQTRPLEPWEEAIENRNQTTAIGMD